VTWLDIADQIKSKQVSAKDSVKLIKKRVEDKNPNVQIMALKVDLS
jgi:growth factor-regulated tyrosine kinase substrate